MHLQKPSLYDLSCGFGRFGLSNFLSNAEYRHIYVNTFCKKPFLITGNPETNISTKILNNYVFFLSLYFVYTEL